MKTQNTQYKIQTKPSIREARWVTQLIVKTEDHAKFVASDLHHSSRIVRVLEISQDGQRVVEQV
jgi:hypothetical protein